MLIEEVALAYRNAVKNCERAKELRKQLEATLNHAHEIEHNAKMKEIEARGLLLRVATYDEEKANA